MKRRSGGSSASNRSISCFEPRDVVVADHRLGDARGELVRRIGELGAEREQIALDRDDLGVEVRRRAATRAHEPEPGVQLVDLAVRVDARIGFADARVPSNSEVSPVSPVRV